MYFIIKYTPFWAVPVIMISGEFALNYWFRGLLKPFLTFVLLIGISVLSIVFYYWAGGPVLAVEVFKEFVNILSS